MPRRNRRTESYEPLDLTPSEAVPHPELHNLRSSREIREAKAKYHDRLAKQQRDAKINGGIDWSVCLVPGCGNDLRTWGRQLVHVVPSERDHTTRLPLCLDHLMTAHRQAMTVAEHDSEVAVEALARAIERRQAKQDADAERMRQAKLADTDGDIYFVRLNGLVKVGWSRTVYARLRAYGPDVEVLCVYPGTRDDETNLHRQLTPVRARGREWYEDGPVIAAFVKEAIATHGHPDVADTWSRPKRIVAGKRHR